MLSNYIVIPVLAWLGVGGKEEMPRIPILKAPGGDLEEWDARTLTRVRSMSRSWSGGRGVVAGVTRARFTSS